MRRIALLVIFAVLASAPVGAPAATSPPTQPVETLYGALLDIMQRAESLGFEGRRERLAPVVTQTYDMPLIARASTGRYWSRADPAQQERLVDALTRLSVATYAARFDAYSGERFRVLSERSAPRDMRLVGTEIVKGNGESVPISYLMRDGEGGWRIVDVYLKGKYSELAVRRSEYSAILEEEGFEGLLAKIERKIADVRAAAVR